MIRVCILHQQTWVAVPSGIHDLLGRVSYRLRYAFSNTSTLAVCSMLDDSSALHYPYVLAFEPTFVEIRHVETGSMSQIIQGNNLRCLFADTPPSTTNTAQQYYSPSPSPYGQPPPQGGGYGYSPYAPTPPNNPYGRPPMGNGYTMGAPPQQHMYSNPYMARAQQAGRDEILMVSDDRVMRVQLCSSSPEAQY